MDLEKFFKLRSEEFDTNDEKELELYFELIDPKLTNLYKYINSCSLELIKKLINKDNVNQIYTTYNCHRYDFDTHIICHVKRPDILKYLFECNIEPYKGDIGRGSSSTALYYCNDLEKFIMLVEYGFDLNYTNDDDMTPLEFHEECENMDIVEYIKKLNLKRKK